MNDPRDLELIQLRQQNQTMQGIIKQRGAMAVATLLEGLQSMLNDARAGDPGAGQLLRMLNKALDEADDFSSPLEIVRH